MNRKSKWQEHINVYKNFLTPYNFSCYLLMLSKSHYLIALSYTIVGAIVGICGYKKYIKSAEQHEPQEEVDGIPLQPLTISNIELPASVAIVRTDKEPTELHTRQQNIEDENGYLMHNDGTEHIYDTIGNITEPIYANLQG